MPDFDPSNFRNQVSRPEAAITLAGFVLCLSAMVWGTAQDLNDLHQSGHIQYDNLVKLACSPIAHGAKAGVDEMVALGHSVGRKIR